MHFFIYTYSSLHAHPLGIHAPHVDLTGGTEAQAEKGLIMTLTDWQRASPGNVPAWNILNLEE